MALSNSATITLAVNVQGMPGLQAMIGQFNTLRNQILNLQRNPAIKNGGNSPAQMASMQAKMQASQAQALQRIQAAQQRATLSTGRYQLAMQKLAQANQRNAAMSQKNAQSTKGLTGAINQAEAKVDALWRAAFRLQMLGGDFTRWGQNLLGAITGPADAFGEFEFMSLRAAGSLALFNTNADNGEVSTRNLEDAIINTGKELRLLPIDDVAKATYFWGSTTGQVVDSQQDMNDVMSELTPILQSAEMTQTDYETAIKGTYSILSQYYPKVVETAKATGDYNEMGVLAKQVTEGLFYAAQKTSLEFDDLIQSFKMVGPVAAGVGASFEDIVDLLERLGDLGIRGSQAGRALRQMFIQMARPPAITKKVLDNLFGSFKEGTEQAMAFKGQSFIDVMFPKGQFVGTTKFLQNMALAVKDLNVQERVAILARFSTANLLPSMIALIGQETRRMEDNATAAETAAEQHKIWAETFAKSWELLSTSFEGVKGALDRSIEALKITIGREFADVLKPIFDQIRGVLDQITAWVDANPALVQAVGKFAAILGTALVAVGGLLTAMGSLIGVVAGLQLAFGAFGKLFIKFTGFGTLVAAVVDSIIRNFDMIQDRLQEAQRAIEAAFKNISGYFDNGTDAGDSMAEAFKNVADAIVEHVTNAIVVVAHFIEEVSKFRPLFEFIQNFIIPVAANFFALWTGAKILGAIATVLKLSAAFSMLQKTAGGGVRGLTASLKNFASNHFDLILMAVAAFGFAAYQNNWLHFGDVVDGITDKFRHLDEEIDQAFKGDAELQGRIRTIFDHLGKESGITFADQFKTQITDALGSGADGLPKMGMLEMFTSDIVTGSGALGKALSDLGVQQMVFAGAVNAAADSLDSVWARGTFGAKNNEEAIAGINAELVKAGVNVQDYWKAWANAPSNLNPEEASLFAQAFSMGLEDGQVTLDEIIANLEQIAGPAARIPHGIIDNISHMTDAQRQHLGLVSETVEAYQKIADIDARDLLVQLDSIDPHNLSLPGSEAAGVLIASMNDIMTKASPDMQKIMTDAIAAFTQAAAVDGLSQMGDAEVQQALMQALADMGKTRIDPETFSSLMTSVQAAITEAGGILEPDTLNKAIQDAITSEKIEFVDENVMAQISTAGDNLASAIAGIFKPENFKDMLKDHIGDTKGISNFMKALTDKTLAASLAGTKGSQAQAFATDYLTGLLSNFDTAFPALLPDAQSKMSTQLEKLFTQSAVSDMAPAMQRFAADTLVTMYTALGEDVPPWVRKIFEDNGGVLADSTQTGWNGTDIQLTVPTPEFNPGYNSTTEEGMSNFISTQQDYLNQHPLTVGAPTIANRYTGANVGGQKGEHGTDPAADEGIGGWVANAQATLTNTPLTVPPLAGPDTAAANTNVNTFVTATNTALTTMNVQVPAMIAPDTSAATTAVNSMASAIVARLIKLGYETATWGGHAAGNFADGIRNNAWKAKDAARDLAADVAAILHFSEPKEGPLRGLFQSGQHLVQNLIDGMHSKNPKIRHEAMRVAQTVSDALDKMLNDSKKNGDKIGHRHKKIADDAVKTQKKIIDNVRGASTFHNYDAYLAYLEKVHNRIKTVHTSVKKATDNAKRDLTVSKNKEDSKITYESKNKKVIEIRLIASSPDGTVDRVELKALRKGVMEGLSLAGLEHIVNVQ